MVFFIVENKTGVFYKNVVIFFAWKRSKLNDHALLLVFQFKPHIWGNSWFGATAQNAVHHSDS